MWYTLVFWHYFYILIIWPVNRFKWLKILFAFNPSKSVTALSGLNHSDTKSHLLTLTLVWPAFYTHWCGVGSMPQFKDITNHSYLIKKKRFSTGLNNDVSVSPHCGTALGMPSKSDNHKLSVWLFAFNNAKNASQYFLFSTMWQHLSSVYDIHTIFPILPNYGGFCQTSSNSLNMNITYSGQLLEYSSHQSSCHSLQKNYRKHIKHSTAYSIWYTYCNYLITTRWWL